MRSNTIKPYFAAVCLALSMYSCFAETTNDSYQLVWADEFESNGKPSRINWTYEEGFVRNEELQWYQPENATCKDGHLIIEARRERKRNPSYRKDSRSWRTNRKHAQYTSACLTTQGLHSWKYGRFEIKAKIKTKDGLWPAIWFLGIDGEWPSNGEIDLMEYYQGDILANACWATEKRYSPVWDSVKTPVTSFDDPDWDDKWHIWRMDWDRDSIELYVDDILLNTIDVTQTINAGSRGPKNPFHQPQYLLLNLAIGGTQGGDPSDTDFPSQYIIDYVRVYQK